MAPALRFVLTAFCLNCACAHAAENWIPRLPGLGEGQVAGAAPPAGVYLLNDLDWVGTTLPNGPGIAATTIDIAIDVPVLLWAPGVRLLGADYVVGAAFPVDYVSTYGPGTPVSSRVNLGTRAGAYETVLIPGQLSWKLSPKTFIKAGIDIYLPDGNFEKPNVMAFPNSIGWWVVEPTLGISYVPNGWNLSASLFYDHNFVNPATGYTSGDVIGGDYTVMKTIGRVGVGIGGYSQTQISNDVQDGLEIANSRASNYGIGPMVSYDFGSIVLQANYNRRLADPNVARANEFWTEVTLRF